LELEKAEPNLDSRERRIRPGPKNHPADIPTLITTFRVFRHGSYIDQAIGSGPRATR
jgi:hypothetical protein